MATVEIRVLECDICGTEEKSRGVETHTLEIDGGKSELEACRRCWAPAAKKLDELMRAGRGVKGRRKGLELVV